jgi:hypothetical protein
MTQKKHWCLIGMPRTGSELVMHHLESALKLEYGGEFLYQPLTKSTRLIPLNIKNSSFLNSFTSVKFDGSDFKIKDHAKFLLEDFWTRIKIIQNHPNPVIIKTFVSSQHYKYYPTLLNYVFENFNTVLLQRKNIFQSALSGFICRAINTWHVFDINDFTQTQIKLQSTKITVDPNTFISEILELNKLSIMMHNIEKIYPDCKKLWFEDFADNPIDNLNCFFKTDLKNLPVTLHKFIDNYQDHITNFHELQNLYKLYQIDLS